MRAHLALTALLALASLPVHGCATRSAVTTWAYSSWYQRPGGGSLGAFETQRDRCLRRIGAADDPGGVEPFSPQEDTFRRCMNREKWCTRAYHCDKPGG